MLILIPFLADDKSPDGLTDTVNIYFTICIPDADNVLPSSCACDRNMGPVVLSSSKLCVPNVLIKF